MDSEAVEHRDGTSGPECPLCRAAGNQGGDDESTLVVAVRDFYPVSPGHTLIMPVRHVAGLFDLTEEEHASALRLLRRTAAELRASHSPAGFNIGVNDGAAAGQTIPHVHIHLIPRYAGDVDDPRGGIRWVLPDKAVYWEQER